MLRQDMEQIYATMVLVHDMNRFHRERLMEEAANDRLLRSVRPQHNPVYRAVLAWAGRRLVATGQNLLTRADMPEHELTLVEQR